MAITLTGRLLCAAQQTYQINTSGAAPDSPLTPTPQPSSLVGWLQPPQCQVSGDDGISAVMVGETASEVIVAYRGTEPFDSLDHERMVMDWCNDFLDPLVASPNVVGSVHYGFSHGVDGLWAWLIGQLKTCTAKKPLYVIGHSKGGAMANIAAVKLAVAGYTPFVCTFEAARAGDPLFAQTYAKVVQHATRYEYRDDIVPWVPPSDELLQLLAKQLPFFEDLLNKVIPDYVPVGDLRYINWQNQIVGDSQALETQRIGHLIAQLATLNCGTVIDDHAIGPGSGIASVICPGIWPLAPTSAPSPSPPPSVPPVTTDVPF